MSMTGSRGRTQNFFSFPLFPGSLFHASREEPFSALIKFSDLVIYHGGSGVRAEISEAGKPSVIIALNYDQFFNGKNHLALGVGFYYPVRSYLKSPRMLLNEAIEEMLVSRAEHYREKCLDVQRRYWEQEIMRGGGSAAAIAFIAGGAEDEEEGGSSSTRGAVGTSLAVLPKHGGPGSTDDHGGLQQQDVADAVDSSRGLQKGRDSDDAAPGQEKGRVETI